MGKGNLEEAVELAGCQHQYQKRMLIILVGAWIFLAITFFSSPLLYMQPLFYCSSITEQMDELIFSEEQACKRMHQCRIIDEFTLTAQKQLYCQNAWWRVLMQSSLGIGNLFSIAVVNLISDLKGRIIALMFTISIILIGTLFLIYGGIVNSYFFLTLAQLIRGMGFQLFTIIITFLADFMNGNSRPKAIVTLASSSGFVFMIVGLAYSIQMSWISFILIFQLIPGIALLFISWKFLHQSPYILMNKKEYNQAMNVIIEIAKQNDMHDNIRKIKSIVGQLSRANEISNQDKPSFGNIIQVMKQWKYLKNIIFLAILSSVAQMNGLGTTYTINQVGFGFTTNCMIMGITQLSSILFSSYVINNFSRVKGMSRAFLSITIIGLLFSWSFISNSFMISTIFLIITRILSICGNCLIDCLSTQLFTVQIQSSVIGVIQGLGISGGVLAPVVVKLSKDAGIHPISGLALFISLGAWIPYFLNLTEGSSAPESKQTIESSLLNQQTLKHFNNNSQQLKQIVKKQSPGSVKTKQEEKNQNNDISI